MRRLLSHGPPTYLQPGEGRPSAPNTNAWKARSDSSMALWQPSPTPPFTSTQRSVHHVVPWGGSGAGIARMLRACVGLDPINPTPVTLNPDGSYTVSPVSQTCLSAFVGICQATSGGSPQFFDAVVFGDDANMWDEMATRVCWAVGNTLSGPNELSNPPPFGRCNDPGEALDSPILNVLAPGTQQQVQAAAAAAGAGTLTLAGVQTFWSSWAAFSNPASLLDNNYNWAKNWVATPVPGAKTPTYTIAWGSFYYPCRRSDRFPHLDPLRCADFPAPTDNPPVLQGGATTVCVT